MVALLSTWLLAVLQAAPAASGLRPFADYEDTGYVAMSAMDFRGETDLKQRLVRHLPPGVSLVLYGSSARPEDRQKILESYGRLVTPDRIVYVAVSGAKNGFWSRDALPLPLLDSAGRLVLADAKYEHGFEPDRLIGGLFSAEVVRHRQELPGGNFMANHLGDCFVVATRQSEKVKDAAFRDYYGCQTIARLPRRGGIGHIDERARFVNATTVVTDTPDYEAVFAARGFRTVRLPRPPGKYESYANALFVNGTAFVPEFGRASDEEAARVYRSLGFTVVGLDSRRLSADGRGSIHCLAMNYPRTTQ